MAKGPQIIFVHESWGPSTLRGPRSIYDTGSILHVATCNLWATDLLVVQRFWPPIMTSTSTAIAKLSNVSLREGYLLKRQRGQRFNADPTRLKFQHRYMCLTQDSLDYFVDQKVYSYT